MSEPIAVHLAIREPNYLALVAGSARATAGCSSDLITAISEACGIPSDAIFVNESHEMDAIRAAIRHRIVLIRIRKKREIHVLGSNDA